MSIFSTYQARLLYGCSTRSGSGAGDGVAAGGGIPAAAPAASGFFPQPASSKAAASTAVRHKTARCFFIRLASLSSFPPVCHTNVNEMCPPPAPYSSTGFWVQARPIGCGVSRQSAEKSTNA